MIAHVKLTKQNKLRKKDEHLIEQVNILEEFESEDLDEM